MLEKCAILAAVLCLAASRVQVKKIGDDAAKETIEICGVGADAFRPQMWREGKLHFVTRTGSGEQVRQTVYEGTLQGDKIEMTSQVAAREPMKGTAERTKPEAALPPARLPA